MGIATRIAVRLTPEPAVRAHAAARLHVDRRRRPRPSAAIIAAGIVPAALEMMDARDHPRGRGLRRRRLPARRGSGAARRGRRARRRRRRPGRRRSIGSAASTARAPCGSRPTTPSARCCGRAASRRSARSPASRPTTTCTTRSCRARSSSRCCARSTRSRPSTSSSMMNVFHAGDGNLHPLIVFDAREPGVWERVHARRRRDPRGVHRRRRSADGRARHRPREARRRCRSCSRADDLDAQARLRDAFDPDGRANPQKVLPAGQPLRRDRSASRRARGCEPDRRASIELAPTVAARRRRCRRRAARSGRSAARSLPARPRCARPSGIVSYDPADLTVTVGAGTPVRDARRGARPSTGRSARSIRATRPRPSAACSRAGCPVTGGCGYGPLRDRVLEVRFVTADGRLVKGGGPTVKNVTGYDLPRLLVGSLGTLGVLVQVTLRMPAAPDARRAGR